MLKLGSSYWVGVFEVVDGAELSTPRHESTAADDEAGPVKNVGFATCVTDLWDLDFVASHRRGLLA